MEEKNSRSENLKNAFCYIPFLAIVLHFIEKEKTKTFQRNIKYALVLLGVYVVGSFVLSIFSSTLAWFLFLMYAGASFYLGFKAYIGEDVKIQAIDDLLK